MVRNLFSQPYPCETSWQERAGITAGISLFVFLFLLIFAPFGIDSYSPDWRLYLSLGYGLCCAFAMSADYYLIMPSMPELFDEAKWTVGRQILWLAWILLTISLFNSLFSAAVGIMSFTPYYLATSTLHVFVIGIFPVTALVLLDYLRLYQKHARKAGELRGKMDLAASAESERFQLISENENERLLLGPDELLFLTGADNYVEVYYRLNGSLKKKLLRGTLKGFESQLEHPDILRCHRSYIVNLTHLADISGNAQGYRLSLRGADREIPVSRSYINTVLGRLEAL